jgi:hypothetical protein
MGTKNNPGKFDCYHAAGPDEPMFVLLARDRIAPYLVSIWSSIRDDDEEAARATFGQLVSNELPAYQHEPDTDKAAEAANCAVAMFAWRARFRT